MLNGSPNMSPWDALPPRRPIADDFNGCAKTNDPNAPVPDPQTMPNAEEWNTKGLTLVSIGKVVANAVISVTFSQGGAPQIAYVNLTRNTDVPNPGITIARTPGGNAVGDFTIAWPQGTFPNPTAQPVTSPNPSGPGQAGSTAGGTNVTNGVRIVTTMPGGLLNDVPFTVEIR